MFDLLGDTSLETRAMILAGLVAALVVIAGSVALIGLRMRSSATAHSYEAPANTARQRARKEKARAKAERAAALKQIKAGQRGTATGAPPGVPGSPVGRNAATPISTPSPMPPISAPRVPAIPVAGGPTESQVAAGPSSPPPTRSPLMPPAASPRFGNAAGEDPEW
jgi:hypothetical protein